MDQSYSLKNVSISSTLDTAFIIDKNNDVVFVEGNGYRNLLSYLQDEAMVNRDVLIENANKFIADHFAASSDLPNLVYFSLNKGFHF